MRLVGSIIIFFLLCFHGNAQEKIVVLKNVNIVDVVEGSIHKGQDVVMKGGISGISSTAPFFCINHFHI